MKHFNYGISTTHRLQHLGRLLQKLAGVFCFYPLCTTSTSTKNMNAIERKLELKRLLQRDQEELDRTMRLLALPSLERSKQNKRELVQSTVRGRE
jgi:hypothetical protein